MSPLPPSTPAVRSWRRRESASAFKWSREPLPFLTPCGTSSRNMRPGCGFPFADRYGCPPHSCCRPPVTSRHVRSRVAVQAPFGTRLLPIVTADFFSGIFLSREKWVSPRKLNLNLGVEISNTEVTLVSTFKVTCWVTARRNWIRSTVSRTQFTGGAEAAHAICTHAPDRTKNEPGDALWALRAQCCRRLGGCAGRPATVLPTTSLTKGRCIHWARQNGTVERLAAFRGPGASRRPDPRERLARAW